MEISLLVRTSPEDVHRLTYVRRFIQTAVEQGHTIRQCFQSVGVKAVTQPETWNGNRSRISLARSCCFAVRLSRSMP